MSDEYLPMAPLLSGHHCEPIQKLPLIPLPVPFFGHPGAHLDKARTAHATRLAAKLNIIIFLSRLE